MRITFITPQPPEQFGGGGMLIYAHLLALSHLLGSNNLLYFGPESKSVDIASLVKEVYYVPQSSNVEKVKAVMTQRNYTTLGIYYEQHKQEIVKMIKEFSDFVWVEFTKTGHLINDLQNAECYVACYAHNYEHDYYMISERNIYYLFKAPIIENEKLSCSSAQIILGDDSYLNRIKQQYNSIANYYHLPFYSFKDNFQLVNRKPSDIKSIIVSGSFAYGHSLETVKKILAVWRNIDVKDLYLCLCGSGMERLSTYLKDISNLVIYNKPYDEYPIIQNAKVYLNPFSSSSGVLTRNLVAMAVGVPIVGLADSFKGYSVENKKDVIMCEQLEESIHTAIKVTRNSQLLEFLIGNIINTFNTTYSLSCGKKNITSILQRLSTM